MDAVVAINPQQDALLSPDSQSSIVSCARKFEVEDMECPLCYEMFCEPVYSPCNHLFCRNCLAKALQMFPPRCPICRQSCDSPTEELELNEELRDVIRAIDPSCYDQRAEAAAKELEAWRNRVPSFFIGGRRQEGRFEVLGAGAAEVNGVYIATMLPTYRGPTMYQQPGTSIFIFRWRQREWIIARLSGFDCFRDNSSWYYKTDAGSTPSETPPRDGWSPYHPGSGVQPAPEVLNLRDEEETTTETGALSELTPWRSRSSPAAFEMRRVRPLMWQTRPLASSTSMVAMGGYGSPSSPTSSNASTRSEASSQRNKCVIM